MWTATITCILMICLNEICCYNLYILNAEENRPESENLFLADSKNGRANKHGIVTTNDVTLIKRLVPVGYKTPQFEYDRKYNRIFVPKYRMRKRKPISDNEVFKSLYNLFYRPIYGTENPIDIINLMIEKGRKIKQGLRADMDEDKEYDPYANKAGGGRPVMQDIPKPKQPKHFNFPHFSLYDYWTLGKILFHDKCPPHQALVGKKCIYAPMS